jgi:ubiquitin-conjugating enzyme E2 D/E
MSNKVAVARIKKELAEIQKNPPLEVSVGPAGDDLFHWEGVMNGPQESPYANGFFKFTIDFTDEYPMKPPHVRFTTKVFHPNVSACGEICVDILKNNWSSAFTVSKVMLSISSLLTDPNPDSALNIESAQLYKSDRNAYNKEVKKWVKLYASPESL